MGHHIDDQGRFQSDRYPDLEPDKVVISLTDPLAQAGLRMIAILYQGSADREFGDDLLARLDSLMFITFEKIEKKPPVMDLDP